MRFIPQILQEMFKDSSSMYRAAKGTSPSFIHLTFTDYSPNEHWCDDLSKRHSEQNALAFTGLCEDMTEGDDF